MNDIDLWQEVEEHENSLIGYQLMKLYKVCYDTDKTIDNEVHEIALGSINSIYKEILNGKTFNNIIKTYKRRNIK
jgi:hypothetical protein